ncbi:MAG: hypothetical protein BMS9Abin31_0409 [Gammaproteobacteria bacterium]|nr:MAG: hypothetical protein BMS9Abin31_0409 [Gammaproteobacteria bacterium]
MQILYKYFKTGLIFSMALLILACSSKTTVESDLGMSHAPDWVNEGTQYLNNNDGRLFHGVGQAPAIGDKSLQISTADNRARAEVARILSSFMDVVSNDYTEASGSGKDALSQQAVSRQIKNFTKVNLTGVKIIGHWKNKKDGSIFSIAELDMQHMKKTLSSVREMNKNLSQYISNNANNIFDKATKEK